MNISLLLALCVALTLTACSKDEPAATPKKTVQTATKPDPAVTGVAEQVNEVTKQVSENVE